MQSRRATIAAITLFVSAGAALAAISFQPPPSRQGQYQGQRGDQVRAQVMDRFDADRDGTLCTQERQAARDAMHARMHDRIVDRFDTDGDGQLSDAEHQAALAFREQRMAEHRDRVLTALQQRGLEGLPPHVADALAEFDMDGDGFIADDERILLEIELDNRIEARKAEMLERFDANEDGALDQAERQTARETVRAEHEAQREARHAEMLAKYDANQDGVLDQTERQTLRAEQGPPARDALLELFRPRPGRMMGQRPGLGMGPGMGRPIGPEGEFAPPRDDVAPGPRAPRRGRPGRGFDF